MWTTITGMLQILGTLLVRLSSCLLVLRMPPVGHTKQLHARAIYMLMAFFLIISTASFFVLCFQCMPIQGLWDESLHARCIPKETRGMIQKVFGSKSWGVEDTFSGFLLTKHSLRYRHQFPDCQSPLDLLTQPPNSFEGEVGSPDDRLFGLCVSGTIHWGGGSNDQKSEFAADKSVALPALLFAECIVG